MTFSLIGPFAFGQKVTSGQFNQLDADHANALDKSAAGDTLAGPVNFSGSGRITANLASALLVTASGGLTVNPGGTILVNGQVVGNAAFAVVGGVANAIAAGATGGISDGGVVAGIRATVAGGISDGGFPGGIRASVADGIAAGVAGGIGDGGNAGGIRGTVSGGIQSGVSGGIELTGGGGDYVQYQTGHTTQYFHLPLVHSLSSGWSYTGEPLTGPATATTQIIPLGRIFNGLYNNAVLSFVQLVMAVGVSHSGVPTNLPSFSVKRVLVTGIGSPIPGPQDLFSGGSVTFPTPGSGSAWYDSANLKSLQLTCDQNNTINAAGYYYYVLLTDENGTNALANNLFYGFQLIFTGITNNACG